MHQNRKTFLNCRPVLPVFLFIWFFTLSGCGNDKLPIDSIQSTLKNKQTYSILLNDMKQDGNFFKSYFHKYKIVQDDYSYVSNWMEVPKAYYKKNQNFLGMVLAGKKDGQLLKTAAPPGYQYVGDPRYGSWHTNSAGHQYWGFNRSHSIYDGLNILALPPIYRNDYTQYQTYSSQKRPYFGSNNQYGTSGSVTQKQKPDFFQRRMAKKTASTASFSQKVNKRIGRTKTSIRGRSGGRGK